MAGILAASASLAVANRALGEERKFAVMLAHSPKSFAPGGSPGLPPDGLPSVEAIRKAYFDRSDPSIDSFAEYWQEISYGDVFVTGETFAWVTVPWTFDPAPPNAPGRASPENFINLRIWNADSEGTAVPEPYAYGAGEDFCDERASEHSGTEIDPGNCGALIIIDLNGDRRNVAPPGRGLGMLDKDAVGVHVWTPGERFLDLDGDDRWDGIDEKNDMMCHGPDGCQGICTGTDEPCTSDTGCPFGETCGDAPGSGPRGCSWKGCGNLIMAFVDWDGDGQAGNDNNCVFTGQLTRCGNLDDPPCPVIDETPLGAAACIDGFCKPGDCALPVGGSAPTLPECCEFINDLADYQSCIDGGGIDIDEATEGVTCGDAVVCCEFAAGGNIPGCTAVTCGDGDNEVDSPEPFEDYMVRWDPNGHSAATVWIPVDANYVQNNYPGDVAALLSRTGNGYYNPPDLFFDRGSTKMMQDAGASRFAWKTPKPGARKQSPHVRPTSGYATEEPWYEQFWSDRYGAGSAPPPWPGGDGPSPPRNSPRMRRFDPDNPSPPIVRQTEGRRWFKPNRGGWNGRGRGLNQEDPFVPLDLGTDNPPEGTILPEETFGYYDGWVEHDDLPSSKYHREGDKRLGEITSPSTDTVPLPTEGTETGEYTAIFGADIGDHDPNTPLSNPDQFNVAAGPYAVKVHGQKGFDAGDVCILEWLTWRTDGTSRTVAYQWDIDNDPVPETEPVIRYHPFAGPKHCTPSLLTPCTSDSDCGLDEHCVRGFGFRDYNLDGMIDQGECRPELSENYSVDSNPDTPNDGTHTDYPFNRRRLVEDVIEALDPSVDWDDFIDANSMDARVCLGHLLNRHPSGNPAYPDDDPRFDKSIAPEGVVSGIVIVPAGSYTASNLFPLSPGFYPVHNEDNDDAAFRFPASSAHYRNFNLNFHDLVICAECRSGAPAVTGYAAHEYGHAWEGFPDLYDYDFFGNGVDEENCPIGEWDLMSGGSAGGGLVHPIPILKGRACTAWTDPVDLTTVVTPGVAATITLPPAELVRDNSYYFLENEQRPEEHYYFWSAGSGFDERLPGEGMLILHTDTGANPEGHPLQQNTWPWSYYIVQADGRGDLEACRSDGNGGDDGDIWPGSTGATQFNFDTNPSATWYAPNSWTGLDITNVQPDGMGSVRVTLTWMPTNIPSLRITTPPGGESTGGIYPVGYEATDVYGGTTIQLYYMEDEKTCRATTTNTCIRDDDCQGGTQGAPDFCRYNVHSTSRTTIGGSFPKGTAHTVRDSKDWDITGVDDGRYVVFAKLTPGVGSDGTETDHTRARASRNNEGNGTLTVNLVNIVGNKARSETWTVIFNGQKWSVHSTLTQPILNDQDPDADAYPKATTGTQYTSMGGEVKFRITAGSIPFAEGDSFTFTTTGITAVSRAVTITAGETSEDPIAVIHASPLSGRPPLTVDFDGRDSVDPNGANLDFFWDFGDGDLGAGATSQHVFDQPGTFTVVLRVENPNNQRFGVADVDILVTNNSPTAVLSALPTSGLAPLQVSFNAVASSDSETPPDQLIYLWDYGDGTTANNQLRPGLDFQSVQHTYRTDADGSACTHASPCEFLATLTVIDTPIDQPGGQEDTDSVQIVVGNSKPFPNVTVRPTQGPAPLEVEFNAMNSTDPDDDPLTVDWDFGDGETELNLPITGQNGTGVVTHKYEDVGEFLPTAVFKDGHGGVTTWPEAVGAVTITLTGNEVPSAAFTVTPAVGEAGVPIEFDAGGSIDLDGVIEAYVWDFGDGNTETTIVPVITHTYEDANLGGYVVQLTVRDNIGAESSTSRTIVVVPARGNLPPIAHIATGSRNGVVPLSLTLDGRTSFDPDNDPIVYSWSLEHDGTTLVITTDGHRNWNAAEENPPGGVLYTCSEDEGDVRICAASWGTDLPDMIAAGEENVSLSRSATANGATLPMVFRTPGLYSISMTVDDGRENGAVATLPEIIIVTKAGEAPPDDDEPGQDVPDGDNGDQDSADQRPGVGMCGVGMLMSLFGSLLGLTAMRATHRRQRP